MRTRLVLWLCLTGCGLKYVHVPEPLLLPGDRCRLLAGTDDWQYPLKQVQPSPIEGLPDDVAQCLMAGISQERTQGPALAKALEGRLQALGWLEAKVDDTLVATLGPRYEFGVIAPQPSEAAEGLKGPFVWARVVLMQESLSRKAGCQVAVERGAPDREAHQVQVTFTTCSTPRTEN